MNFQEMVKIAAITQAATAAAIEMYRREQRNKRRKIDHRKLPRSKRKKFQHDLALVCINRDYLGGNPLHGADFHLMFRLRRGRFQVLMEDFMASNIHFYKSSVQDGHEKTSLEARLLLPLKTLAYGVPPHTFIDYFQMSKQYARDCCKAFDHAMKAIYMEEFLRLPTSTDLKKIVKLHRSVHGVDGMIGSLDCTHTFWKNCPKAWQGSFKGKESKPSIVMETVADYRLFLWHASYGYTGTTNDITVLSLSPLMSRLTDGSFEEVEKEAAVVPFKIEEEEFNKVYFLVDGIYPSYSRFVRGVKLPSSQREKKFTSWQEGARKDVERAFGVMKNTWQFLDRPILLHDLKDISNRVVSCLLLHNILVTDRTMREESSSYYNYRERYDPSTGTLDVSDVVQQPADLRQVQAAPPGERRSIIGVNNLPTQVRAAMTRQERFAELNDPAENRRLHMALMDKFN